MALLEFKQRVKLPEEFFLDRTPGRARRWPRWPLAVLLWCGFSGLCFGINSGSVPLAVWVEAALGEPLQAAVATNAARAPSGDIGSPPPQPTSPAPLAILTGAAPADLEFALPTPQSAPGPQPESELGSEPDDSHAQAAPEPPGLHADVSSQPKPADVAQTDVAAGALAPQPPAPQPPAALPPPSPRASSSSAGTSCEAAVADYQEEIRIGGPSAPADLSRSQYAAVLENGRYFSHCGVPDEMSVDICVAVRQGRVLGVTVGTDPGSATIQSCVARAVRGLGFPSHPRMDVTRTRFAAN